MAVKNLAKQKHRKALIYKENPRNPLDSVDF